MGNCIICGTSTDGPICDVHQEDALFEFEGDRPEQLTPGRFYRGTVDGYAEFGVFVDIGNVTGLLHRSKLDRRLESLDWEVGDRVAVQVNNVRDNGDIDLEWSIRQTPEEFRGLLVDAPDGDRLADEYEDDEPDAGSGSGEDTDPEADPSNAPESGSGSRRTSDSTDRTGEGASDGGDASFDGPDGEADDAATGEADSATRGSDDSGSGSAATSTADDRQRGGAAAAGAADRDAATDAETVTADDSDDSDTETVIGDDSDTETVTDDDSDDWDDDSGVDLDRLAVEELRDRVGDVVRLEGEVVSVRQTSGPTVFELRDETGVVDCAAFVEAGVRAYPDVEADDVVRLEGEVRLRRDEIQIETESLVVLSEDAREAVVTRMDEALEDRASPDDFELLGDDDVLEAVVDDVTAAATTIRRAVLESRPVVIRHDATTDGYVAGAAVERAVLPLVEAEHASADAVYHYFDRRPLEDGVYDMNDATKDATRMLGDRERHDEKLPLFVFAAAGSTAASTDGLELLDVYGAPRVVLDGRHADAAVVDEIDSLVTAEGRTAATVAANVAAAVNEDVREDLRHLPAVSYWDDAPESYVALSEDAGVDAETARQLREAVALEAFYQSYEDKRELIVDLLFEKRTGLAEQVSGQFRTKLEAEVDTATANIDEREVDGATVVVLDTDAYTHQYDFPPTRLLLDELARRLEADAVVGVATDELHVRTDADLDVASILESLRSAAPNAGVSDPGARQPKLEFLRGEREAVIDAVVAAVADQVVAPSA